MLVFAVDEHLLWQVVWVSLLSGVGISVLFSLVILGAARAYDARRAGRGASATLYAVLALIALAVFALGVVLGVRAMIDK
jgi:uncharacterized membrane protein